MNYPWSKPWVSSTRDIHLCHRTIKLVVDSFNNLQYIKHKKKVRKCASPFKPCKASTTSLATKFHWLITNFQMPERIRLEQESFFPGPKDWKWDTVQGTILYCWHCCWYWWVPKCNSKQLLNAYAWNRLMCVIGCEESAGERAISIAWTRLSVKSHCKPPFWLRRE